MPQAAKISVPVLSPVAALAQRTVLQRQCACGQHTGSGGECEECKKKGQGTLQRAAIQPQAVQDVPPVVHGPILISLGDLNGWEFGTRERNPYRSFVDREPDETIANGVAVYYGDRAIPAAASMAHVSRAYANLGGNRPLALAEAETAVALVPDGFEENRALAEARAVTGDKSGARAALQIAAAAVARMEPSAQEFYRQEIDKKLVEFRP